MGKITPNGVYLEQLETEPWKYMPDIREDDLHGDVVKVRGCHSVLLVQE